METTFTRREESDFRRCYEVAEKSAAQVDVPIHGAYNGCAPWQERHVILTPFHLQREPIMIEVTAGTNIKPEDEHPAYDAAEGGTQKIEATASTEDGETLQGAVEMYSEDLVFRLYKRELRRMLSNAIRSALNSDRTPEQVETELEDWRPDTISRGSSSSKDPVAALKAQMQSMTEEERKKKIAELMQAAGVA